MLKKNQKRVTLPVFENSEKSIYIKIYKDALIERIDKLINEYFVENFNFKLSVNEVEILIMQKYEPTSILTPGIYIVFYIEEKTKEEITKETDSKRIYDRMKATGLLNELFPIATGNYEEDIKILREKL